jgi:Ribosomal protein L17
MTCLGILTCCSKEVGLIENEGHCSVRYGPAVALMHRGVALAASQTHRQLQIICSNRTKERPSTHGVSIEARKPIYASSKISSLKNSHFTSFCSSGEVPRLISRPFSMAGARLKYRHLGRTSSHRQALLRNLVTSLFTHESISTTYPKAKEAQRLAEKLITLGKKNTEASKRRALSIFFVR